MGKLSTVSAVGTFFRHGSNVAIAVYGGAIAGALVAWHAPAHDWAWALAGVACFPFIEYLMHRFLLHGPPSSNPWVLKIQRRAHYDHHVEPNRLELLFSPLWFVLLAGPVFGAIDFALLRAPGATLGLLFGQFAAYLVYEWVHYRAHVPLTPLTPWGRWLKKMHLWHHYRNEHYWYGVTSPLIDVLVGTMRPVEDVAASATTRHLHGGPQPAEGNN